MKPLDRLSEYLGAIERRLRLIALTRGIAVTAGMALALTIVAVLVINQFAFSNGSVIGARVFLFLGLAFAIGAALIIPVIRLNRRNAARRAEAQYPEFEERLLTFTERIESNPGDPFLSLLADDTLRVAQQAEPQERGQERVDLQLLFGRGGCRTGTDLARVHAGLHGLRHVAVVGGAAQGRYQAVLFDPGGPGQQDGPQTQRPVDHGAPHRLHGAQGALLRQVLERVPVGAGRNGRGTGRHGVPVPDRGRAGKPRILRRGRRREEQHLQAERSGSSGRQEDSRHLSLPRVAGAEG